MKPRRGEGRRAIATMSGASAIHASGKKPKSGKETIKRNALEMAALHSKLEKPIGLMRGKKFFRTSRAIVNRTGQFAKF